MESETIKAILVKTTRKRRRMSVFKWRCKLIIKVKLIELVTCLRDIILLLLRLQVVKCTFLTTSSTMDHLKTMKLNQICAYLVILERDMASIGIQ